MITSYKDLLVWQRSMDLVASVYGLTAKLPANEQFGLMAQMRRAAVSVPSNIAEGYGRQATGEYRHHLLIGRGSSLELETQLLLCQRLHYVDQGTCDAILQDIAEIAKMLGSLSAKLS